MGGFGENGNGTGSPPPFPLTAQNNFFVEDGLRAGWIGIGEDAFSTQVACCDL